MILANQILPSVVSSPPVSLTVYASLTTLAGNDKDVYYRINGGSWVFMSTIGSTVCGDFGEIFPLNSGDIVEFAVEDSVVGDARSYQALDNSNVCSSATDTYSDDRAGTCGGIYFTVIMGATNRNCAMQISNGTGCA